MTGHKHRQNYRHAFSSNCLTFFVGGIFGALPINIYTAFMSLVHLLAYGQVSAWQSQTLLPISCKSVQPVPALVEEPF